MKHEIAKETFKICKGQTYALCAAARCDVYDGVAYCLCEQKTGDSISEPFALKNGKDVCEVNAEGAHNQYMVSTFSFPESLAAPGGSKAIYKCSGPETDGAYAQCDGGLCFTSTVGTAFPGFEKPVAKGDIICSCPITESNLATKVTGYEILGPYPCQKSYFANCKKATANSKTGSTIYVGAPTDVLKTLTGKLTGNVPAINECTQ